MARAAPRQPGPPAGVIFGCNRSSEEESLNGLFGMSSGHWSLVKEIIPGTPCFLFNFNTKELHGVFRAVSAGTWNIDPLAYGGKPKEGSMYPAQVRVEYCPRCPPMAEQYFKPAIAANYFNPNRFRWELNERQVEALLDLFLGVGAPWPPQGHQQHAAPAYVEDTAVRPYTIEPATRSRLGAHRERNSPYRSDARRYASTSPVRDYRRHADEDRHRRVPEIELPRSLRPHHRQDDYRRSPSPCGRYADRPTALPEELRLPPVRSDAMGLSFAVQDAYRPDLRHAMPAVGSNPFSMYGDSMNGHHTASVALREPSLALSPVAVRRLSPPQQPLLLEAPGHHRQQEPGPASAYDLSQSGHVGEVFTGFASNTAILDQQHASLPALPADLTLSDRFQQLPESREQRHVAQIRTEPLQITATTGAGRSVTIKQPEPPAVQPASFPPAPADPTTLVISSIPHSCTTAILVSLLDKRHRDQYDFVHYQPSEEYDSTAVVNFIQPRFAREFQDEIQDAQWSDLYEFDTSAIASVAPNSIQGKEALLAHHSKAATKFGGAPSNESRLPSNRPLFFFCARKRPASAEHQQAPAPLRPRMPSTASHPAMQLPTSLQAGTSGEARGYDAAMNNMEADTNRAGDAGVPLSPTGRLSRPASPSNLSDHDRAHVRSRPGSAAATSSRPPGAMEPLKITIKQEPGLAQPITPSPESALDGMGHTLSMLDNSRGVSSSPRKADPPPQEEAAAWLQNLRPELQRIQRRSRSPTQRPRSPSRHSHRHHSSSRQHGSKSTRPSSHADKDSDRHEKHSSRRSLHTEYKSSRGVQKVSARDAKPPRDRSSKDRDSKHRSKPADTKVPHRSRQHQSAEHPSAEAAPNSVHISVNAAPFHGQPSNGERDTMAANGAASHAQAALGAPASSSRPYEEAVADNSPRSDSFPRLQHTEQAAPAVVALAGREQSQAGHFGKSRGSVGLRPAEFGGDFLSLATSSP